MEQIRVTEQASAYDDLQRMSVHDLLTGINREDRRVADAVAATIPTMERLVERIVERMQRGGRMFYIGAGTSGRLAVTDASELPPTYGVPFDTVIGLIAGGDGALRKAVEHAEDDTEGAWRDMQPWRPDGGDILIGVAASGTTPYVVGGLRTARAHGLLTGAITCNPRSPVAAEAEYALEAVVGPEFVTGFDADEGRHGAKTDAQHDLHGRDDPAGARRREQDGQHAADEQQTRRPRHAHDRAGDGDRRGRSPRPAARLRFGQGRTRQDPTRRIAGLHPTNYPSVQRPLHGGVISFYLFTKGRSNRSPR